MAALSPRLARPLRSVLWVAWLAAGLAAAEAQAPAQSGPEAVRPDRDIVVTGSRDRRREAAEFVERITVETDGQVAAFEAPVCPATLGMPADYGAAIVERVRAVAAAAGARVAGPRCTPNILIILASDGLDLTRGLHDLRPRLFEGLTPRQIALLTQRDEPAKAWQVVEMRGRDGRKAEAIDSIPSAGGPPRFVKDAHVLQSSLNSRIGLPTRQDLTLSIVVIDLDAIAGRSLRQLADYAAMRALARTRPPPAPAAGRRTILSLFDDPPEARRPGRGLTARDLAYLRGLYAGERSLAADRQLYRLARAVGGEGAAR